MDSVDSAAVVRLIDRARQGDGEARDQLFETCRSYLGFVARAQVETWLRVKVDASDLVQQTMLEAHRDFGIQGRHGAGMAGLAAQDPCAQRGRLRPPLPGHGQAQVRREVPLRDPADSGIAAAPEPAAPGAPPARSFLLLDNELRVAAALAELSPDYQEVIVLRNLQRLPFNDVAEQMGRSRPAVQMLWMRAIKKLQEALGGTGVSIAGQPDDAESAQLLDDTSSGCRPASSRTANSCLREHPQLRSSLDCLEALERAGPASPNDGHAAAGEDASAERAMPADGRLGRFRTGNRRAAAQFRARTSCSRRSAAAGWAWSTRPGRRASTAPWRSR